MADLYLDPLTHDLKITNNTFTLVSASPEESRQRVKIALLLFKGEWFANTLDGVPYYQTLLTRSKATNKTIVDSILARYITELPFVDTLLSFNSTVDQFKRVYTLVFNFKDIYGNTVSFSDGLNL